MIHDLATDKAKRDLFDRLAGHLKLTLSNRNKTLFQDLSLKMRNSARDLPTSGYAIVVDGCVKTEFETEDGVESGARDLKRRFPMLQIRVYDAHARADHEIDAF